ncbi:CinY protein [Streptomyces hesseae]|uniref:CinY protein n=1 Tax=Streptomyces hesseae TaxID=3075519 RepID=A0ABU2SHD5_9ACTN|nr:CinY protein [Streptomyces sp. DSM 40473]MDT0448392.1 CinY protein [Streptomyces sp. DSM 40473]
MRKNGRGVRRGMLSLGAVPLAAAMLLGGQAHPAAAFGTINALGQHAEHERITRAALACQSGQGSDGSCFEPRSLDQVAGHTGTFGAVGSPDSDEITVTAAHCDNADHLARPGYPISREQASSQLISCVTHLQWRFGKGTDAASGVLGGDGAVAPAEVDLGKDCVFMLGIPGRGKCNAIEGFGRALHGVQDFYSHSNWTDRADPARPIGKDNPPGLQLAAPSPLLQLSRGKAPSPGAIPEELTTGCFSLLGGCSSRVDHADVNKDTGLIDPVTGATSGPTTPRGKTAGNFDRAVQGAIADTRRQWADFRALLRERYGKERGDRIGCALTHDSPVRDCR